MRSRAVLIKAAISAFISGDRVEATGFAEEINLLTHGLTIDMFRVLYLWFNNQTIIK